MGERYVQDRELKCSILFPSSLGSRGREGQSLLPGDTFSDDTSRCAGAAEAWSRGGFQPIAVSWQGEIWQSVLHGRLQLNFPVLSASSELLEHPEQQQNWFWRGAGGREQWLSVVISPLMAAVCFWGTEELKLFLLSFSPSQLPSAGTCAGLGWEQAERAKVEWNLHCEMCLPWALWRTRLGTQLAAAVSSSVNDYW